MGEVFFLGPGRQRVDRGVEQEIRTGAVAIQSTDGVGLTVVDLLIAALQPRGGELVGEEARELCLVTGWAGNVHHCCDETLEAVGV